VLDPERPFMASASGWSGRFRSGHWTTAPVRLREIRTTTILRHAW
jgi:hypothetical protein